MAKQTFSFCSNPTSPYHKFKYNKYCFNISFNPFQSPHSITTHTQADVKGESQVLIGMQEGKKETRSSCGKRKIYFAYCVYMHI
jgi:hypothetical protein